MIADLYSASVRAAGSGGLAHRTEAGFVVVTSPDGHDIIALIEERQNEPDLIDQVVARAQTDELQAFAMLFTAGGELYLVASGSAVITVTSASARLSMAAMPREILIQPVNVGLGEGAANVRLHAGGDSDSSPSFDLPAGTCDVGWAEVAIGAPAPEPAAAEETPIDAPAETLMDHEPTETVGAAAVDPVVGDTDAPEALVVPVPVSPAMSDSPRSLDSEPNFAEPPTESSGTPADDSSGEEPVAATVTTADTAASELADASEQEAGPGPAMVLGVSCPLGHHNHPDAAFCTQCGTKMTDSDTTVLINGPRPPLGILVVDDGTTYSLNQDLIIGREPTSHPDVERGVASPMILSDESLALSRKHARFTLDEWSVSLVDLSSSNGTFISRTDDNGEWAQLEKGGSIELQPGDRIRIGGRTIQVELHHSD